MHGNNGRPATPQAYFHSMSRRYDVFNRILSFGSDVRWRAEVLKNIHVSASTQIVDVGSGTGVSAKVLQDQRDRLSSTSESNSIILCASSRNMIAKFLPQGFWRIVQASAESLQS